jgi:hypothetical protein
MRQHPPRGSRSRSATVVPGGELFGLPPERREHVPRIQEIRHVVCLAVEVLAAQPEAEVPGERPRSVSETGRVAGLPGVTLSRRRTGPRSWPGRRP